MTSTDDVPPLDPYTCIAKRNTKYATGCTEVYLSNRGATEVSNTFQDFPNLEVIWVNGNRLSRLDYLTTNVRIREVYCQDNRLVSLAGISSLKFLQVLMAKNNQLRNLDKQILLLERFAFLKKLDLSGNPVAEEPDYRLRLIYNVPQVEILDSRVVKGPERLRAEEVVPNLDKASAPKSAVKRRGKQLSVLEKMCRSEAHAIEQRRKDAEFEALGGSFATIGVHEHARLGLLTHDKTTNRDLWSNPTTRAALEDTMPTYYEKPEMRPRILNHEVVVGKKDLVLEDVARLVKALASEGIVEIGRVLGGDASLSAGDDDGADPDLSIPASVRLLGQQLHKAALAGSSKEVRRALERGANVNGKGPSSWSPLIAAAANGHCDIVDTLLEAKADMRLKSSSGNTALMVAVLRGQESALMLLKQRQAEAGASAAAEVTIHDVRGKDYFGNARQARQSHPADQLAAGKNSAAPAQQVVDWLLSQPWPRSDSAKMAERIRQEQEDQGWADLARNCDALEKRVAATRKVLGPILADLEVAKKATFGGVKVPKDLKDAANHNQQLEKLNNLIPKQLTDAGAQLPQDMLKQLLASRAASEVPVALRLEGLVSAKSSEKGKSVASLSEVKGTHRSDVFPQSFVRAKRAMDETGRFVVQVSHHKETAILC